MKNVLTKIKYVAYSLLLLSPSKLLATQHEDPQTGRYGLDATAEGAALPGIASDTGLATIVGNIIYALMGIVGTILVLFLIYGGFLWMTAGGEEKKIEEAKKIIKNVIVGLIIIFLSYGIARFVIDALISASAE